jgi:hypothetical protein
MFVLPPVDFVTTFWDKGNQCWYPGTK